MGTRYYAYPVDADDIDDARTYPHAYLGVDPYVKASGSEAERPEVLYLGECWRHLQRLLIAPLGYPSRPAAALVAGQVFDTQDGWIPYIEVLSPAQVADAARDLRTIEDADVVSAVRRRLMMYGPEQQEISYLTEHLGAAREFTARLAKDGRGLIYLIG